MKKIILALFTIVLCFSFVACGKNSSVYDDSYMFLNYKIPSGFEREEDSSGISYSDDKSGYFIFIYSDDDLNDDFDIDTMLEWRTVDLINSETIDVNGINIVYGEKYDSDIGTASMTGYFTYNNKLFTFSVSSIDTTLSDEEKNTFINLIQSISIND